MDLSHWNLVDTFSLNEASCLAAGVEPAGRIANDDVARVEVISEAMNKAAFSAIRSALGRIDIGTEEPINPLELESIELRKRIAWCRKHSDATISDWSIPDDPTFDRNELARWFAARDFMPAYSFTRATLPEAMQAKLRGRWPWGNHETLLLQKFSTMMEEWWSDYDPLVPSSAPTNEEVTNWLVGQGIAKRVAEVMAQMARPEHIPPGPRKK